MDLMYTTYQNRLPGDRMPDWMRESYTLCSVSSQNVVVFTTSVPLMNKIDPVVGNYLYCADLNTPWDCHKICSVSTMVTCLEWDGAGSMINFADASGNIYVWRMVDNCLSDWKQVTLIQYDHERFIKCDFLPSNCVVTLNQEQKDSLLYQEKFQFGYHHNNLYEKEGCILLSATGLVVVIVLQDDTEEEQVATSSVGQIRRRICHADMAISNKGELLMATCSEDTPVIVYSIHTSFDSQGILKVKVLCHSRISLPDKTAAANSNQTPGQASTLNPDTTRISYIKFVLSDCSDALVLGLDSPEGGRVQIWELDQAQLSCHKIFISDSPNQSSAAGNNNSTPSPRYLPDWRNCNEFSGGGSRVTCLTTPRSTPVLGGGGEKPSCYVVAGYADGSIQCLIRDKLQQIASVELPRAGNISAQNTKNAAITVTICNMAFTSTGTGLVVTDSLGQLYLYRMSPIADPGGPHVAPFLVTLYEYCLVSGKDWWDLALAANQTNVQEITDKLSESLNRQPQGMQNYCYWRYMAIKTSLFRLSSTSQYRAADSLSLLTLKSIASDLKSLLSLDPSMTEKDPVENFETIVRNSSLTTDLDVVISNLVMAGFQKDVNHLGVGGGETSQNIQYLMSWLVTLALHILSAVPEFKTRRGPGYWLIQEGGLLPLRECLVMCKLWGLASRSGFITRDKEMDLVAKLYNMSTRLLENRDDETLLDECLILPSLVIVPALDSRISAKGVLSALQNNLSLPLSFRFGREPDLQSQAVPQFLEGLAYTEESNSKYYFDSIRKCSLGGKPYDMKQCSRCNSNTQATSNSKSVFSKQWERRWRRRCLCGGSWRLARHWRL